MNMLRRKMCVGVLGSTAMALFVVLGGAGLTLLGFAAAASVGGIFATLAGGVTSIIGLLFSGVGAHAVWDSFTDPIWED